MQVIALADPEAGTALPIGAGTFFLAEEDAEISDTAMVGRTATRCASTSRGSAKAPTAD